MFLIKKIGRKSTADAAVAAAILLQTKLSSSKIFLFLNQKLLFVYLNLFLQEQAGPLKQYDWGPSPKARSPGCTHYALSCAGAILKNRPVCYGTSGLKNRVYAVTRNALLKTPTLKSNKR